MTPTTTPAQRLSRKLLTVYGIGALAFLSGPLLIVVGISFSSAGGLTWPPPGWSTQWYQQLFGNTAWASAAKTSISVGLVASVSGLLLGSLAAYGLARGTFRGRGLMLANFLAPLIVPPIVTAVALYMVFSRFGLRGSFLGLSIAHTVIVVPYVVLLMTVAFQSFDYRLELMARSLGADWWTAFRLVVLPILAPSIGAAWLIAFVTSFDEVIVTIFVAGTSDTVPKLMFSQLRDRIDPTVTALSTLLLVFTVAVVGLGAFLIRTSRRRGTGVGMVLQGSTRAEEIIDGR